MNDILDYPCGISAIDAGFPIRNLQSAVHIIVEGGRVAVIDTSSNRAVPRVLDALQRRGMRPEDVDYVILTHIHLDHAGGAGLLMTHLPNAILTVHPRGARHISAPDKLMAGTIAVYGKEQALEMYGDPVPVPRQRIVETPHDTRIELNGRELRFLDTPGHARHHVCIFDSRSGSVFAGDTFGLSYRELDRDGRQYVFPTTSPVQFDPDSLHRSIDLLLSLRPEAIYLMHFSEVRDVQRMGGDLHRLIEAHEQMARQERDAGPARHQRLRAGVEQIVREEAKRNSWRLSETALLSLFGNDIELNAQGLGAWLDSLD